MGSCFPAFLVSPLKTKKAKMWGPRGHSQIKLCNWTPCGEQLKSERCYHTSLLALSFWSLTPIQLSPFSHPTLIPNTSGDGTHSVQAELYWTWRWLCIHSRALRARASTWMDALGPHWALLLPQHTMNSGLCHTATRFNPLEGTSLYCWGPRERNTWSPPSSYEIGSSQTLGCIRTIWGASLKHRDSAYLPAGMEIQQCNEGPRSL